MQENVEKHETLNQGKNPNESTTGKFFKNAFTRYINISLSIIGLFLHFLGSFIGLVSATRGGVAVSVWFMFLGWSTVVAGLLTLGIISIKNKKFELSPEFIFSIISIIIVTL